MSLGGVLYHRDTYRVYARQYSTTDTSIGSTGDSGIPPWTGIARLWVKVEYNMDIYRVYDSRVQRGQVPGLLMTVELIGDRYRVYFHKPDTCLWVTVDRYRIYGSTK